MKAKQVKSIPEEEQIKPRQENPYGHNQWCNADKSKPIDGSCMCRLKEIMKESENEN